MKTETQTNRFRFIATPESDRVRSANMAERLRDAAAFVVGVQPSKEQRERLSLLMQPAADEIDRLRAAIAASARRLDGMGAEMRRTADRCDERRADPTPWQRPGYVSEGERCVLDGKARAYREAARRCFEASARLVSALEDAEADS